MKIAIVCDHFPPDSPPCGHLVDILSNGLSEENHVVVICRGKEDVGEDGEGGQQGKRIIRRIKVPDFLPGPVAHVVFSIRAVAYLLKTKVDAGVVVNSPPILLPFAVAIAKKIGVLRSRFVYWCMDIQPESAMSANANHSQIALRAMMLIEKFTRAASDSVVVLSENMQETLEHIQPLVSVIYNPAITPSADFGEKSQTTSPQGQPRFVFAGNIGLYQSLDMIVDVFADTSYPAELVLIGDGKAKEMLLEKARDAKSTIRFVDPVSPDELAELISENDIMVVSLANDVFKYGYPSKYSNCLNIGRPVLYFGSAECEIVKDIETKAVGWYAGADKEALSDCVSELCQMTDLNEQISLRGEKARGVYNAKYSDHQFVDRWRNLLYTIAR